MKALYVTRPASPMRANALAAALVAVFALGCATLAPSSAQAMDGAGALTPLAQAAQDMRADYRLQQWKRLAQKNDRDSLIAAVVLGMANDEDRVPIEGHAEVERRLAAAFGDDPLALFTLALACQSEKACGNPQHYDELVRIAPDNAMNWLLLPNDANPGDAQLHAAAAAGQADTHLRDMLGIVRAALADQPAPAARSGIAPRELAQLLRRKAAEQVPLPKFRAVIEICKGAVTQRRDDCIALGRHLQADRSGSIVSIMVGNVLVRRLMKGSPEDIAAKQSRAQYVWMGEQLEASKAPYEEQLQAEVVAFGEWEAVQRSVERLGAARTPPSDWVPKDPQTLLMSEERTPAAN